MNEIQKIYEMKEELSNERDLCAELCNIWLTKMYRSQDNKENYEKYLKLINETEPYTQELKAQITRLNKQLCDMLNVDTLSNTDYEHVCKSKYGFDQPNS
jgi:hypothetical protein